MICRKRKKVIRVRRNPVDLEYFENVAAGTYIIHNAMMYGNFEYLTELITYYNQGAKCDDCDQNYMSCDCEYCEDCNQKRCVCRFLGDDSKPKDRIRIRKIIWEFIRHMGFELKNNKIYRFIPPYYSINEAVRYQEITTSEANFLNSLTAQSKFPKYTSIMKRIFEIN